MPRVHNLKTEDLTPDELAALLSAIEEDSHLQAGTIMKAALPQNFRSLHGLRHVCPSILASSGRVDLYTPQRLLTHKDPRMTQRYAHLQDEALKRASGVARDLLGRVVKGGTQGQAKQRKK